MTDPFFNSNIFQDVLESSGLKTDIPLVLHREIPSTSSDLLSRLAKGAPSPTVVIAQRQTGGRGRSGNTWHSVHQQNLYISVSLPIEGNIIERLPLVPLAAGVAAGTALIEEGIPDIRLKWPNDLLIDGKKVGGILCETPGIENDAAIAVVGMGVNIGEQTFPDELQHIAAPIIIQNHFSFRETLAAKWIAYLLHWCGRIMRNDKAELIQAWKPLGEPFGRRVKVGSIIGKTVDLNDEGRLLLQNDNGEIVIIPGGMVESLE